MLHINSKKISLSLCLCALSALSAPAVTHAESAMVLAEYETGSIAAIRAAEQKAALAQKAADRAAKKAAEAKAAAEAQAGANAPKPESEEVKKGE